MTMNLLVYNVRSILETKRRTKFPNALQVTNVYDIISLTETWLTEHITDAALFLSKYDINRKDRPSVNGLTKHGGVLIGVSKNIPSCPIECDFPDCVITRLLVKQPIIICCIYSAPSDSSYSWPTSQFISLIKFLNKKKYEFNTKCCIIVGDINFSYTDWPSMTSTHWEEQYCLDELTSANLQQLIITKKRKSLDILLCNTPDLFLKKGVDNHLETLFSSNAAKLNLLVKPSHFLKPVETTVNDFSRFAFEKADWKQIKNFVKQNPFKPYCLSNVDLMLDLWYEWLYKILIDHIPIKTKHRMHLAPWVTSKISHLIKNLETKQSELSSSPSTLKERKIDCLQTELSLHLEDDHYQYETSLFREWKFSNLQKYIKLLNQANHLPSEIYLDGKTAKSDVENMFNTYFQSVFCRAVYHPEIEEPTCTRLTEFHFNINEICDALVNLDVTKAKGPDKISNALLRNLSDSIPKSLHLLFNLIANKCVFPTNRKISEIVSIFKDGDKQQASNYRPISLLSTVSKLLEKLIYNKLVPTLTNTLSNTQHGFRRRRSTITNLIEYLHALYEKFDDTTCIYLAAFNVDFRKAFDKVNHSLLIEKLFKSGFAGPALKLIESYLENRAQTVKIRNSISSELPVLSGVLKVLFLVPHFF